MISAHTLDYAKSFLGVPYIWGGQSQAGVDCSGFVIMVLQAEGRLPNTFDANSQGLYNYFKVNGAYETKRPQSGCLAFYGRSIKEISHVALCLDGAQIIEAAGGDSTTKSAAEAKRRGAHVRIRPLVYRKDLVAILTTDINEEKVIPITRKRQRKKKSSSGRLRTK